MKKVIFIGNRIGVLNELIQIENIIDLHKVFILSDSLLHKEINKISTPYELFDTSKESKTNILNFLSNNYFDILVSNGCPFVLPIEKLKLVHPHSLFINTHPSYLPYLKGKTPLNGVFFLGYNFIGATTHFMDSGIDTGNIIYQEKIDVTDDLDQGLIYFISFKMESIVFRKAFEILKQSNYIFQGTPQLDSGSYFNRTEDVFRINFQTDNSDLIQRKINSLGMTTLTNDVLIEERTYHFHNCEILSNEFLLKEFSLSDVGTIVYRYSDKLLIRTIDGLVKVSIYEK